MRSLALLFVGILVGLGCEPQPSESEPPDPCAALTGEAGPVDGTPTNPFPSMHLMARDAEGACRVRLPTGAIPTGVGATPFPVERFDRLDGFSLVQTSYWRPGVAVDPASLPAWDDPQAGLGADASMQLWDVDRGVRLPAFAEVDAYPDQSDGQRAVLVRPLAPLPEAARVAVVVTDGVRTLDGGAVPRSEQYASWLDDVDSEPGRHHRALLDALGLAPEGVVLAWDFRTASRSALTRPLDVVLEGMRAELPADPDHEPEVVVDALLDRDLGDTPALGLWRELWASVRLTHYLWDEDDSATPEEHDQGAFRLDATGAPEPRDLDEAYFLAVVPESVREADPGTVPVVIFGHGIFSHPRNYITSPNDASGTIELLERLGAIGIGGEWRGLTERDRPDAFRVATDVGRFPLLTDKMVQGVSNQLALARLVRTRFREHPVFASVDGGSLVDPERVLYFGISLGGIEGFTFMANTEQVQTGVLHVPGSTWSTMLERSTNWNAFEPFVIESLDAPWDRQLFYAASQLFWDAVDPASHTPGVQGRNVLLQVSVGDEQVPNFTAASLARAAGLPLVEPSVEPVAGLESVSAPQGPGTSALMQFDPQLGRPPFVNRPSPSGTGAHDAIRRTDEVMVQVEAYFTDGAEGTLVHPCGDQPCVLDL